MDKGYETYLRSNGFDVESEVVDDIDAVKVRCGIPDEAASCHTAVIGDYVVEGHVPVEAIERLLDEQPSIDGIALPGMPSGSPGMGGPKTEPFEILALTDGQTTSYMSI